MKRIPVYLFVFFLVVPFMADSAFARGGRGGGWGGGWGGGGGGWGGGGSGGGGRAPARFASFPEIEISRRLYRSGESEYGINKVQCRLKDVVELFTDTGIGTRAYSIIEQGQVGWLVNAKPVERRVLFEEAAGINKYKQKKEAALRRLKATGENLTRVSDIVGEVKRQLNSLNRQAKKAERYKVVKDELKEIDLKLSRIEFTRMVA